MPKNAKMHVGNLLKYHPLTIATNTVKCKLGNWSRGHYTTVISYHTYSRDFLSNCTAGHVYGIFYLYHQAYSAPNAWLWPTLVTQCVCVWVCVCVCVCVCAHVCACIPWEDRLGLTTNLWCHGWVESCACVPHTDRVLAGLRGAEEPHNPATKMMRALERSHKLAGSCAWTQCARTYSQMHTVYAHSVPQFSGPNWRVEFWPWNHNLGSKLTVQKANICIKGFL